MTIPPREGWAAKASNRYGYGKCPNCLHDEAAHFWWERPGQVATEMERGCRHCTHGVCRNVRMENSMSSVNLCERCGSLMLARALGSVEVVKRPGDPYERVEFCPACVADLVGFLAEHPTRNRGEAFTEPWEPAPEKSETVAMLEAGPCGAQTVGQDGVEFMCLRAKGHKGYHIDGTKEWLSA